MYKKNICIINNSIKSYIDNYVKYAKLTHNMNDLTDLSWRYEQELFSEHVSWLKPVYEQLHLVFWSGEGTTPLDTSDFRNSSFTWLNSFSAWLKNSIKKTKIYIW